VSVIDLEECVWETGSEEIMVKSSEHLYLLSTRVYPQLLQQRTEEFYLERLIMQLSGANGDSPWPAIRTMPTRQWSSVASHTPRAAGDPANRWNNAPCVKDSDYRAVTVNRLMTR